jgi:hypothetical protein
MLDTCFKCGDWFVVAVAAIILQAGQPTTLPMTVENIGSSPQLLSRVYQVSALAVERLPVSFAFELIFHMQSQQTCGCSLR